MKISSKKEYRKNEHHECQTEKRINRLCAFICVMMFVVVCCSCSGVYDNANNKDEAGISIVSTIFPGYDFAREITDGIDGVDIHMLLKPGSESHSYEPTPQDIILINNCDVFIYGGGESDEWVRDILESADMTDTLIISLMDCVDLVEEEIVEGMEVIGEEEDGDEFEIEYDEHVWTSPLNVIDITRCIENAVSEKLDSDEDTVRLTQNADGFYEELMTLDAEFREIVENGKRKTIVFGDRFPCRYFADEYGLSYYAAFPGCSSETEPAARTVAFLIDKINAEEIPVVLYPELSNRKIAETICSSCDGTVALQFNSCHNVTSDQFESGVTYLELMRENLGVLELALN